jgi:hypothetical protein
VNGKEKKKRSAPKANNGKENSMRRIARVKLHPQKKPASADPTFVRLCHDITMSERVKDKARRGLLNGEAFDDARQLERRAWTHLERYVSAQAFVANVE